MALTRRQFLEAGTLVAIATAIAGCQGDDGDGAADGGDGADGGGENGGDGADGSDGNSTTETVDMVGGQFDPRNLSVATGTTVEWVNQDGASHTVTDASDNWSFDEEAAGGESVSHTFEESGVYDVYCRFHGTADLTGMSMKIAVGGATIASPLGQDGGGGSVDGDGGGSDDSGGGSADGDGGGSDDDGGAGSDDGGGNGGGGGADGPY
jgi:plastocyanin